MVTLKPLDHLAYIIKRKDKNLYVVNDCLPINSDRIWGERNLEKVIIYKTIEDAREIKRHFDTVKKDYPSLDVVDIEIELVHKKEIMIAKLKRSSDETN